MKKYKQTMIPSVKILAKSDLGKYIRTEYTKNIQGKTVVNKHSGLTIYFGSDGNAELSNGRRLYAAKAAIVQCLPTLLEHAEYNNFGQRKFTDEKNVFGYANFKAKVRIDNKIQHVRIAVVVKTNGKAYYCHEISIKK